MFNQNKIEREERLRKIFDFDNFFTENKGQYKILNCEYVSIKGNIFTAKALFHKAALVIRVGNDPLECIIFDKMYFTLFWVKMYQVELKNSNNNWRAKILMSDNSLIHLDFKESPNLIFENMIENNLKYPTLLMLQTEIFENKISLIKDNIQEEQQIQEIQKEISENEDDPLASSNDIQKQQIEKKQQFIDNNSLQKFLHSELKEFQNENDLSILGLKIFDNSNYKLSKSYSQKIIIPHQLKNKHIQEVAKFRVKQRLPILSFVNFNKKLLFRSSQISTGVFSKRCKEDEMLLYFIGEPLSQKDADYFLKFSGSFIEQKTNLLICDARSKAAALGNKLLGKGWENKSFYMNTTLTFHSIANLDQVRQSYQYMLQKRYFQKEMQKGFFKALGNSEWYEYISDLIEFSIQIAEHLNKGQVNVLLHCSDGWDRTSQVSSLVQLILDKKFRTLKGFLELIIKEFSENGFQFSTRGGLYNDNIIEHKFDRAQINIIYYKKNSCSKESPIFLQFLDCIRQMIIQKPIEFQFGLKFIEDLAFYSTLGIFQEFLFDNERTRMKFQNLLSANNFFEFYQDDYINKNFDQENNKDTLLDIRVEDFYMDYWKTLFIGNVPFNETCLFYQLILIYYQYYFLLKLIKLYRKIHQFHFLFNFFIF